ncbi:MAG: lysophospholipid acyltransferase family protein [Kiritimatiellia bacterium]|nr:lysophospholipid acyltransferase family protein [Kiritimatiellia bacterium]
MERRKRSRRRWRAIRRPFEFLAAALAYGLLAPLPRRAILGLANLLGTLGYWGSPGLRRIAEANLDIVFGSTLPGAEKRRILRAAFRNMTRTALDIIWFSASPVRRLKRWVRFDQPIDIPPPGSRPRLCLTAHVGNWELMGQAVALEGGPLSSVAAPLKNPRVDALFNRARKKTGQKIISRKGALKAMLAVLREGGWVALLIDQNTPLDEGGEFYDFFGIPASVSPIAGLLACRTGASISFGFSLPRPDGSYRILQPEGFDTAEVSGSARNDAMREATRRILDVYQEVIRTHPECWLWMYKRWKHVRPGDDPARYPFYSMTLDAP